MSLRVFEETLRLEVDDGAQAGPVRVFAPALAVHSRGIALVSVLSRDWGVVRRTDGGKSVWAEFDCTEDGSACRRHMKTSHAAAARAGVTNVRQ
jgi:hypothetical protein